MAQRIASLYAEIGADTKGLKRGLEETKGGLQGAKKSMMDFKTVALASFGAVTAGVLAAKKVFDMGKEGAQLEFVRGKFDRLSESVGSTSDALLKELKTATRGTRSDMELVASAADFMSLGLAKTEAQVIRLTRVSGALGMDMNQLVLTLTNKTTMRFDALGVAVDGFDEKVKKLEASGLSAQDAFTEAFLQQAEEQISRVGDVADTSAGQIMQMEAQIKNLSDSIKVSLAPAIADVSGGVSGYLNEINTVTSATETLRKAEILGIITLEDKLRILGDLSDRTYDLAEIERIAAGVELGLRDDRRESINTLKALVIQTEAVGKAGAGMTTQLVESARATKQFGDDVEDMGKAGAGATTRLIESAKAVKQLGDQAEESTEDMDAFLDTLDTKVDSPIKAFIEDMKWWQAGGWKINDAFADLQQGVREKKITPAQAEEWAGNLYKATQDLQVDLDMITADEAAANIESTMGVSLKDAKDYVSGTDGIEAALEQITQTKWYIDVFYREHGKPAAWPGGQGPDPEGTGEGGRWGGEAEGARGLNMIVPPGFPNDSFNVRVSSGEHVSVTPPGVGGSGATIIQNVYPSPGMDEYSLANYTALVLSQKARRSAIAGAGYVGY